MKTTGLFLLWLWLLLAATAVPAQTNALCCRYPVRVFGVGSAANLTPLFQWWKRQPEEGTNEAAPAVDANRPLTAWYRITGTKVATMGSSWVLNAVVYTSPSVHTNARVILNHPPAAEEQLYYELQAQLAAADQQIAAARHVYSGDTNAEAKAAARAVKYSYTRTFYTTVGVEENSRVAARDRAAATAELDQLDQLRAARDQMAQELKRIPTRNGQYVVDWFALAIGHSKLGLPIYDLGLLGGTP